jgi:predicted enzyme related to lactoylglutathione lyase
VKNAFCRYDLRTTDADGARVFYTRVLGHDRSAIWPLHEQARARGAPAHWLGQIGVDDPERTAAAFVERGAQQIGPTRPLAGGGTSVVVRDPGGAIVGMSTPSNTPVDVVFHALSTNDAARAETNYRELFGWSLGKPVDAFRPFAWSEGEKSVGVIADVGGRTGVHPHWLFFFEVASLDDAIATARSLGGKPLEPAKMPDGRRFCVLDDPQGAAFGLVER